MENNTHRHILQWHITHKCNLRCAHCYQTEYASEENEAYLLGVLDKYEDFLCEKKLSGHIYLTGGEPMTHPFFFGLAEEIIRRGMLLTVLTNGTLISEEDARRFASLGVSCVQVSLDGTREIHDAIRGTGCFDKAIGGIDALKKAGVRVMVSFTAQRSNYRSLPALAEICKTHNVDKLWWDRVVEADPKRAKKLSLTTRMFKTTALTAGALHDKYLAETGRALVSCERPMQFIGCSEECFGYACSAGGDMITILADGSVMPCRRLPFVIGNINQRTLSEILSSSTLMAELDQMHCPTECIGCQYLDRCMGGAKCVTFAATGKLGTRDVNCFIRKRH